MPDIEIISHPLCPYAHRLMLIAAAKGWRRGEDYEATYLPYATLRETAPQHSPTGKFPVLKIGGAFRTDETVTAAEYLDGVTGLGLLPSDPGLRLTVREREKTVAALLDTMRRMYAGQTAEGVQAAINEILECLETIDAELAADGTTEKTMRMDVAALGPALVLLTFFPQLREHPRWKGIPRLHGIAKRVAEDPSVKASLCSDYAREFDEFFKMTNSAFPAAVLAHPAA